jgi:alkylation response protein AidB-like acyl-CoA dehydrogenase
MSTTTVAPFLAQHAAGGSFLIQDMKPEDVFTPEDFTDEQKQIAQTASEFASQEIVPVSDRIEAKEPGLMPELLKKAGALGLMAVDVPEIYGGLEMDKVTSALVAEAISKHGSFVVAFSAHAGIGTLPILWYGTDAQKEKYLGKLATGEFLGAYALSEASSGSPTADSLMFTRCLRKLTARNLPPSSSSAAPPASPPALRNTSSAFAGRPQLHSF